MQNYFAVLIFAQVKIIKQAGGTMFTGKKVVVGISGGIAAYKACDIVSWLRQNHAFVRVIMTESACEIVTPLTLQTLSGNVVYTDLFATGSDYKVVHIEAVTDADLFLVLPATGNIMAKMAHGIADEVLSTSLLAAACPVMVAPAMNVHMFENPATQENMATLKKRGCKFIEPAYGHLACGVVAKGRLAELDDIKAAVSAELLKEQDFSGKKILITAGPTREPIDAVRYITNRSSGRMGYAVAAAAQARGAEVILVSGPVNLSAVAGVETINVTTADEMYAAVMQHYADADIVIKAAAVADYKMAQVVDHKMKKSEADLTLQLLPNVDILKTLGQQKTNQILVGFAAETNNVEAYAAKKIKEKNLDMIVANDVSAAGAGFDVDTNIITMLKPDGTKTELPLQSKAAAADAILDEIKTLPAWQRKKLD